VVEKVALLTMRSGENRFSLSFIDEFLHVLEEIERGSDANVLVVQSGHEKIFSNGIDLDYLAPLIQNSDVNGFKEFISKLMGLFRTILLYPMPTIAAITGHAFAAGAIMSCYFDYRYMRSDRGFFCFPEVDLGIPFLPGMMAAMRKVVPIYKLEEMVYQGKRLTGNKCEENHIVTRACHMKDLMEGVMTFSRGLQRRREIVAEIKKR
jgi:enoyl-CoA hydratase/carnithine racemase